MLSFLKSKTFWSALAGAIAYVLGQTDPLDPTVIITAIGAVGAAVGIRDAAKNPAKK